MKDDFDFQVGRGVRFHGSGPIGLIALGMLLFFLILVADRPLEITKSGIDWVMNQLVGMNCTRRSPNR